MLKYFLFYSVSALYKICLMGHIGPLCETCDTENIRGDGFF